MLIGVSALLYQCLSLTFTHFLGQVVFVICAELVSYPQQTDRSYRSLNICKPVQFDRLLNITIYSYPPTEFYVILSKILKALWIVTFTLTCTVLVNRKPRKKIKKMNLIKVLTVITKEFKTRANQIQIFTNLKPL